MEVFGALAAALSTAELSFKLLKRIKGKRGDAAALEQLKAESKTAIELFEINKPRLSQGAQRAVQQLQDRLQEVIDSIDAVSFLTWRAKLTKLLHLWTPEFDARFRQALDRFRTQMSLENNAILQSLDDHQQKLEESQKERMKTLIDRLEQKE